MCEVFILTKLEAGYNTNSYLAGFEFIFCLIAFYRFSVHAPHSALPLPPCC